MQKVLVALSGGVDSSVAAALLVEQGFEVIGATMRLWSAPGGEQENRCCTLKRAPWQPDWRISSTSLYRVG